MFLYGLSAVLIGPTLPGMIDDLSLSLSEGGFVSSMQNAGGFVGAVVALFIADRLSRPGTVLVSFGLLAVALVGVGVSRGYLALILAFAATGLFIRILDVMLNAHTGQVGDAPAMSRLHMFFSLGAFVGPLVARAVMDAGSGWSDVYRSVGAVYLVAMVVALPWLRRYLRRPEPEAGEEDLRGHADAGTAASPSNPGPPVHDAVASTGHRRAARLTISLLGAALFFYAIHQVGLISWLPYFLETSRDASTTIASLGLSFYWVGIILGRYAASRAVSRLGVWRMLIGGLCLSSVASTGAVLVATPAVAVVLFALAGLTSGATIPLAYTGGYEVVPARRGAVTAAMSIVMLAGRFLGPWVMGTIADRSTLIAALLLPAVVLLVAGLLAAGASRAAQVSTG
jgi:FHS family glucose/mannose:H+ symporter-like MFS transporter